MDGIAVVGAFLGFIALVVLAVDQISAWVAGYYERNILPNSPGYQMELPFQDF